MQNRNNKTIWQLERSHTMNMKSCALGFLLLQLEINKELFKGICCLMYILVMDFIESLVSVRTIITADQCDRKIIQSCKCDEFTYKFHKIKKIIVCLHFFFQLTISIRDNLLIQPTTINCSYLQQDFVKKITLRLTTNLGIEAFTFKHKIIEIGGDLNVFTYRSSSTILYIAKINANRNYPSKLLFQN